MDSSVVSAVAVPTQNDRWDEDDKGGPFEIKETVTII